MLMASVKREKLTLFLAKLVVTAVALIYRLLMVRMVLLSMELIREIFLVARLVRLEILMVMALTI